MTGLLCAWEPPAAETSMAAVAAARPPPQIAALAASGLFPPLPAPKPGDWLADEQPGVKDRAGQTLQQWRARGRAPGPKARTILLVPLGDVGSAVDVEALIACVRAFYLGMDVRCLPPVPPDVLETRVKSRKCRGFGKQLLTTDLHNLLAEAKTPDAFVVMGFTMLDLYPREEWNFVFGQAMAGKGTGVFSFARYQTRFASAFLRRCCMVLTHEIGHLFGLAHCVMWHCCMNGSNHDEEADGRPMALCPACLHKVREAIGPSFDLAARDVALSEFLEAARLPELADFHRRTHAVVTAASGKGTGKGTAAPAARGQRGAGAPGKGTGVSAAPAARAPVQGTGRRAALPAPGGAAARNRSRA